MVYTEIQKKTEKRRNQNFKFTKQQQVKRQNIESEIKKN